MSQPYPWACDQGKGLQGCEPRGRLESHITCSRECKSVKGWTLTLPSELPLWELEFQMDSQIFRAQFQGSKLIGYKNFLYHWKSIETEMSKMDSHCPFGHLKHKLWSKERPRIKLEVWLLTTKSQERTRFPHMQAACDIPLENTQQGL
jgi:hypothetical protein